MSLFYYVSYSYMVKYFFVWIGGKVQDIKHFAKYVDLSNIATICEPFCGTCAFSRHFKASHYILSDIDPQLIQFYRDVKGGEFPAYIEHVNKVLTENDFLNMTREKMKAHSNIAKQTGTQHEWYCSKATREVRGIMKKQKLYDINKYDEHIKFFTQDGVELFNHDYMEIFNRVRDDPTCFVFLDPPYFSSFNSEYHDYTGEAKNKYVKDNTVMYIDILNLLTCKCRVMLIINKNAITEYIYAAYIVGEYKKKYNISYRETTHLIVANYHI